MACKFDNVPSEGLHEECGVFGIYSDGTLNPAYACYNGLLALQHRGQESCGIAVNDCGVIDYHKDMGLVSEVFNNKVLDSLPGWRFLMLDILPPAEAFVKIHNPLLCAM